MQTTKVAKMPDNDSGRINKTRWFICLFIWWVLAVFMYLYIASRENSQIGEVTKAGIPTILENATKAALPLLERDVQSLTGLARQMASQKNVVNVAIIDHKNKIIAYTDPEQPVPPVAATADHQNGVSHWQYTLEDGTRAVCFSADIDYAETKIGEVILVMAAGDFKNLTVVFTFATLISLVLVIFGLLLLDFKGISPLMTVTMERFRSWSGQHGTLADGREVICPLCGTHKPLTRTFLIDVSVDHHPALRPTRNEAGTATMQTQRGIRLREIARREDLGWLRRQIVIRCADIIKKLAGE